MSLKKHQLQQWLLFMTKSFAHPWNKDRLWRASLQIQAGEALGSRYFFPLDSNSSTHLEQMWTKALQQENCRAGEQNVAVMFGRSLKVPTHLSSNT